MADFFMHWIECVRVARNRRRVLEAMSGLSDHHLADIGLERGDIDTYLRVGYPWPVFSSKTRYDFQASLQGCG